MLPAEHHGACWELLGAAARDVVARRQWEALGRHGGDRVGQRDRSLMHLWEGSLDIRPQFTHQEEAGASSTCLHPAESRAGTLPVCPSGTAAGLGPHRTHLLVEIHHERALLGGRVQHSGAPAGRSRGSVLLYGAVWRPGQWLLGGEALILGKRAGQAALVAGAAPQRGGPGRTEGVPLITEQGEKTRGHSPARGGGGVEWVAQGSSLLPSPELACSAAGSSRDASWSHGGRRGPPSCCQSPWSHQRDMGVEGLGQGSQP